MYKPRTNNSLSIKNVIKLLVLWLQSSCVFGGTILDYQLSEFTPLSGTNLHHITIRDSTGDVYVGGYNELFRLSGDDLALLYNTSTCGASVGDCGNINKVLVIDYVNDRLITCGGGNGGTCEARSLSDFQSIITPTEQIQVVGLGDLSAVGFIAPSPDGHSLYTASSDDGTESFSFVSRRSLNHLDFGSRNAIMLQSYQKILQYVSGFSYDGFSYFVSNRENMSATDVTSRLSRICENGSTLHTFSEVHLSCNGYVYVRGVSVGAVGRDLAASLGLQTGDEVLYGVFSRSSSSSDSAVCIFTWIDIEVAYSKALEGCLTKPESNNYLLYATGNACPNSLDSVTERQVENFMCDTTNRYTYSQGLLSEAALAEPVLELSKNHLTTITTVVEQNHTIAFLGTADGHLIKAQIVDIGTSRVFENISIDSGSVKSDILISQDLTRLTVLTDRKVFKLRVENCARYTTCDDCIGPDAGEDGDPYCGWCTLEKRCSRQLDCATAWLPYNNADCAAILSVEPALLLYTQGSQTDHNVKQITLDIQELPPLTGNSIYECDFNNSIHRSTLVIGASNTCTSPPAGKIPVIPTGKDSITIELAVRSTETGINFVRTDFVYYDCSRIESCSECVGGWPDCKWCVEENVCTSEQCSSADAIEGQNQTYCPQIIPGSELVPVDFRKEIVIETRNLPTGKDYECVFEIEENSESIAAELDGDNIICDSFKYNYGENAENITVAMRVHWGTNIIDEEYKLILYKCAVNGQDCSRCMSNVVTPAAYECVWCDSSSCTFNASCSAPSDICGAPEILQVMPQALAIEVTPPSTRDVIDITANDLGLSEDNVQNITVNNRLCDIVSGSFNIFDQSIKCEAPTCSVMEDCGEADVIIDSNAGFSNTYTGLSYQNPEITDFSPKFGIMSGGTTLNINGTFLTTGSSRSIKIGEADCRIVSETATNITCTTTSSIEGEAAVTIYFGSVSRVSDQMFNYTADPNVVAVIPAKSICSGGRKVNIVGTNMDAVQDVFIVMTIDNVPYTDGNCTVEAGYVTCYTPQVPADKCPTSCAEDLPADMQDLVADLQVKFDGYVYNHTEAGKTFTYKADPTYFLFGDSDLYTDVKDDTLQLSTNQLKLHGRNLDCASEDEDVEVYVGDRVCTIKTFSDLLLICTTSESSYSDDLVTVSHGNFYVEVGEVNSPKSTIWIVVGSCFGFLVVIILVVGVCLKRRENKAKMGHESLLTELDTMLEVVTSQASNAIAEMALNLGDLAQDLEGHGMPFRGPKEYAMIMMFSGYDERPKEVDDGERKQEGLLEFSRLLMNKDFLLVLIDVINNSQQFSVREKGNFASLLAIGMVVEDRLNYLTSVLENLVRRHIDDMVTDRKAKQVLRRNEGVTEKLLSNWVCLCMYSHLQEHNARPLYLMYQSIRCYVSKGAVDAVTHHSQHSLSLNTLLRENVEYEEITLDVVTNAEEGHVTQVKVLSCDTINQVKEKILDVLFKNKPYSKRRPAKDVDLDWQHGSAGHLVLRDLDNTSKVKGNKKQLNTMEHFKIRNGYKIGLVPIQDEANVRISQANDGLFGLENLAYNGAFDPESVIYADEIDVELGTDVFHLVDEPEENATGSKRKKKTIDELFFPRVLSTKQTILEYVQSMFQSILRPASEEHNLPLAIQYLFDLLDREQRKHKVGQDVLKAWKNQSLCERFWVTVINHPEYLFDIPKTNQVKDALSVISNAFTDSCATNQLHYSKHTDAHRLLYAKEIPTYRNLVDSFYESIQAMPELDHMVMEVQLKDTAKRFQGIFCRNSILKLLYAYARDCNKELMKALENDDSCSRARMGFRFEQIPSMMNK